MFPINQKKNTVIFLGLIIFIAGFLRFWKLGSIPPGLFGDEVDTGYQAYSILQTGRDYFGNFFPIHFQSFGDWRMPLYIYFDTLFVSILGLNEIAVRFPAAIFGVLGVIATYFLARKLTSNESVGLLASFLLAISPWHLQFSRIGMEAILLSVLFPFGLILFWKGIEEKRVVYHLFSAFLLGLTVYAYNTPKLFLPIIVFLLFTLWHQKLLAQKKNLTIFVITLFLILIPLGLDFIKGTGQARFLGISIFSDSTVAEKVRISRQNCDCGGLLAKVLYNKGTFWFDSFTKNYLASISTDFLFSKGDPNPRHSMGGRGELYLFELPFLLVGLFLVFVGAVKKKDKLWQFVLLWLILAPVPSALTLEGGTHAVRLFLFLPWLQILVAWGIIEFAAELKNKTARRLLLGFLALIVLISVNLYLHQYYNLYPKQSGRWWNYGYREIFDYVNKVEGKYDKINISPSWEPSIVYTLFYSKYPPEKTQREITISAVDIGKYHFLSPDLGRLRSGENSPRTLYVVNPQELEIADLKIKETPSLKFIKEIKAPDGYTVFIMFSSSDVY